MASSTFPAAPGNSRGAVSVAGTIALYLVGVLVDVYAVINVPGAVTLPVLNGSGDVELTDLGTGLVLLVLVAWASVFWMRRHPFATTIAGGALAVVGVSYVLLLIGAVAYVRRFPQRTRIVGVITGAVVIAFAVREATTSWGGALPWLMTQRDNNQGDLVWVAMPFVWACVAVGVAAAVVFASRARSYVAVADAKASEQQLRADSLSDQMARQAERERIARDMHDALAHRLSVVSLHAGALEAAAGDSANTGDMARTVREQSHAALQDMRGLIGDLRAGPGSPPTIPATMRAVGALLGDLRAAGTAINAFVMFESPERAGALFDSAVYRIVQEALTNAIRHASGAPVDVYIQVEPIGGARIRIANILRADVASDLPRGGNGILGIRERAAGLNGTAWVGAHDGFFIVDVTLPWEERGMPAR